MAKESLRRNQRHRLAAMTHVSSAAFAVVYWTAASSCRKDKTPAGDFPVIRHPIKSHPTYSLMQTLFSCQTLGNRLNRFL